MNAGEWFTVAEGRDQGTVCLVGWSLTAIHTSDLSRSNPWVGLATCPRCAALVWNDDAEGDVMMGREIRRHEDWHAATDYPRPAP